jgi:membrane-bound ClpP family serine protease
MEKSQFEPVNLAEYDVTIDTQGRRKSVMVIPVTEPQIMLSQVVSTSVADTIEKVSNNGPYLIVIQIDNPGGRGEYMKYICDSIIRTKNCPIVAYITANTLGGAYSTAAAVALACDAVYIAPNAGMGAVIPPTSLNTTFESNSDYLETYSSPSLSTFRSYIAALAQKNNRPSLIAMAMLDRSLEVVEVVDAQGNKSFIEKSNRKPTETIVKTWTKPSLAIDEQTGSLITNVEFSWMLSSQDAIETGMADKVANSIADILRYHQIPDAQVVINRQAQKDLKKFITAKRQVDQSLQNIEQMQTYADNLINQYNEIDAQNRNNMPSISSEAMARYRRGRTPRQNETNPYDALMPTRNSRRRDRSKLNPLAQQQAVSNQLAFAARSILTELNLVLTNIAIEYTNVSRLASRWPGALPPDMTVQSLQTNYNDIITMQNQIQMQ